MRERAVAKTALMEKVRFSTWKEGEATIPEFTKTGGSRNFSNPERKILPRAKSEVCETYIS